MILRPSYGCALYGTTYLIDTGDGSKDISEFLTDEDERISLVLTHSHADHIGGLSYLLPRIDRIKEVIIPYYHNEITLISKALKNLLGIELIAYDSWPIIVLNEYQQNNAVLKNFSKGLAKFASEGMCLCEHFKFFNPPCPISIPQTIDKNHIDMMTALFKEPFRGQLRYWLNVRLNQGAMSDTQDLDQDVIYADEQESFESYRCKALFVLSFLERNYQKMLLFTQKPTAVRLSTVVKSLNLTANQASLVFRYDNCRLEKSFLFTGDIDISVFERVIGKGHDVCVDVLKVPHHGSKTGLNESVLRKISPNCAIISHNNKRFGRATDPHPNFEVIELLQRHKVQIYVTNDVIKGGKVQIKKEASGDEAIVIR